VRFKIAHICMDEEDKYSIDAPCLDQGGTVGFGTTYVTSLGEAIKLLEAKLVYFHEWHLSQIKKKSTIQK
jgi:hypothetical protein